MVDFYYCCLSVYAGKEDWFFALDVFGRGMSTKMQTDTPQSQTTSSPNGSNNMPVHNFVSDSTNESYFSCL
ncbi:hypothetical protein BS78_09G245800 [Paspalum vaginatum]|nr:hypothetical protein BS78_09G245800 [Paspalum vaginatum]